VSEIPACEVTFHPHSYGDPAGRLFVWNGALYRGIRREAAPLFRRLFADGVIQRLVDDGLLVDSAPTALRLEGFDLVVRHRQVAFASYPEEWCAMMLRDGAAMMLDLLERLAWHGLTLKDGHPWNVLYDGCRPVYVDLTSLAVLDDRPWPGYDSFRRFCANPLTLMAAGHERIARRLLPEYDGVRTSDVRALTGRWNPLGTVAGLVRRHGAGAWQRAVRGRRHPRADAATSESRRRHAAARFAGRLRRRILDIPVDGSRRERPTAPLVAESSDDRATMLTLVRRVVTEMAPASVLQALSSESSGTVATGPGRPVVCFDPSPARVTRLYRECLETSASVLPLVMDFTDPTPSRGLAAHWALPATQRFQADMVLALGLGRYAVERRLTLEHIADALGDFSRRWVVIDFLPVSDDRGRAGSHGPWASLDDFVVVLKRRFRSIATLLTDRNPDGPRLLLCEK